MSLEGNKALVRRFYLEIDKGNLAVPTLPYRFFVVNRKGTLTHTATGFDSSPSV